MERRKEKKKGLIGFLFGLTARTVMLLIALGLVLSYLSMFVNPAKEWLMTIFGLLFVPFFIANLLLLLWAARRRSRAFVIPLLALLPAIPLVGRYVQFNKVQDPQPEDTVKIVTYNVGAFCLYPERSRLQDKDQCIDSVFSFIRKENPDIVSLQEVQLSDDNVRDRLSALLPGYNLEYYGGVDDSGLYGGVIFSRFPVRDKGKFDFDDSSNIAFFTDLDICGETLRLYNCHLQSYNVSVPGLVKAMLHKDDVVMQETGEKMRSSIRRRPQQVRMLLDDIKNSPVESIVTGDFNDTPMSYTYNMLKKGKKDSFVRAGRGMGGTYSALWPLIRIDYVLFPERFEAVSHKVKKIRWSDHYPVVAVLNLSENEKD